MERSCDRHGCDAEKIQSKAAKLPVEQSASDSERERERDVYDLLLVNIQVSVTL